MAKTQVLGVPSPRVEGEEKGGGKAIYAVADAVGVRITSLPISAEKVLNALGGDKDTPTRR